MSTTSLPPVFNPLRFANRLKEAGVPHQQAEAEAEVLHEALSAHAQAMSALDGQLKTLAADVKRDAENNATKGDIALVRKDMDVMRKDIEVMRRDMGAMEDRLVIRLTKVMMTVAGVTVAVLGCAAGIARLML